MIESEIKPEEVEVTNESILLFRANADEIIRQLSAKDERGRYLYALQRVFDRLEVTQKNINRKLSDISEKYALLNDSGHFIFEGNGNDKSYVYKPEKLAQMKDEKEKFLESTRVIRPYHINKSDLPKNITNQLIAILSPFIISEKLKEEILYGE